MKISVVIPAYERPELLVRCLTSLGTGQEGAGAYEVVVVDDGSGLDESALRSAAHPSYPLVWRAFGENRGRSAARNEGVRSSTGELLVFLDADMEAAPGFLAAHESCHARHGHAAVNGTIVWPKGGSFLRYIGSRGVHKLPGGGPMPFQYFGTGNSSVRRADLPADEPFEDDICCWGGEDLELAHRLDRAGLDMVYEPAAVTYHRFDGTLGTHLSRTRRFGRDGIPLLVERHPELRNVFRLDALDNPLVRLGITRPMFGLAVAAAHLFDRLPLPDMLYDYLTFAAYARGWRERSRP